MIWRDRLRNLWRFFVPARCEFVFDDDLHCSLQELARRERRPVNQVATEMLTFALQERLSAQEYVRRWRTLTPREQQVVALLCRGYTFRQIAGQLVVSPDTVKTHTRNALNKFKLRDRTELLRALSGWDFTEWEIGYPTDPPG